MFQPVSSRVNYPQMEEAILAAWKKDNIFNKSVEARRGGPRFILFDGPPTVNGSPAIHHILTSVFKDVIPRYKVMKGYYAPRIAGWDTHGLPVELEVEKKLGISSKPQIEAYGVDKFNVLCRESVEKYLGEFETAIERAGYWVDMDGAYVTMKREYIESCWWALKQMWDKDLIYKGYRVTPHCPRCGTSLSSHEIAQGYKEDTQDPSVYVKFEMITKRPEAIPTGRKAYLLAWTTTPWTLPGNTALAVSSDAEYSVLDSGEECLIMATRLTGTLELDGYKESGKLNGKDLVGAGYRPLYNPHDYNIERLRFGEGGILTAQKPDVDLTYRVISGDFVTMEDGTGIVHIAPAFGEVDNEAGKEWGLDFVQQVDLQGKITGNYSFAGKFVKAADPLVIADLKERRQLFKSGTIKHTYPFCWRCDSPLLYYAKETWYIRTTAVKERMLSGNDEITWYPEHIKYGRFGDWLKNNIDWAVSRERYWGTPLPVWRCESCGSYECIGGTEDLKSKSGIDGWNDELDLRRPWIDGVSFACSCGGRMKRVPEVIDCWFDSGAMPFAQHHFPFEDTTRIEEAGFPADFICEAIDQTRGWFYSLHAISTLLFDQPSYRNVICLGHILDAKGEKMSKRKGNVIWPNEIFKKYGADALRWYLYTAATPGNPRQFDEKQVAEVSRRVLSTLWNVYSFFIMYANIDSYKPETTTFDEPTAELDKWILSELHQLVQEVSTALDEYNPTDAGRKIENYIDGLSNWYVRRSRRRFWKSENDNDKMSAYATLYTCLVTLTKLMAPFTPFLAEELYQNLVRSVNQDAPESVHLTDYPMVNESLINLQLSEDNQLAMKVCSMGRSARSKAGIKVRQPLGNVYLSVSGDREQRALERVAPLVLEELNVKEIYGRTQEELVSLNEKEYLKMTEGSHMLALATYMTPELEAEGIAREIVHRIQGMRKSSGYEIADHITLYFECGPYLSQIISGFADYIRQETLADDMIEGVPEDADSKEGMKFGSHVLDIGVKKN